MDHAVRCLREGRIGDGDAPLVLVSDDCSAPLADALLIEVSHLSTLDEIGRVSELSSVRPAVVSFWSQRATEGDLADLYV